MPRLSILMPVYNGMPYVREAVESVFAQACQDWELIISDDGSRDETRDYLATIDSPRVQVHYQKRNLGIFGNLNFLLAQARAPIAKILCQDDRLLPGALARVADFMEARPHCAVSRCWAQGDSADFMKGGRLEWEGALPVHLEPAASKLAFATFGNLVGNLCKASCRPRLVLQAGGFDQSYPYAGDYECWARVAAVHGLDLLNEELVFERRHANQNSKLLNRKNELFPQINALIQKFAGEVNPVDLPVLRRHWAIHFLAQRLPRSVRQLMAGKYRLAVSVWEGLPLRISPLACMAAYPLQKFNLRLAHVTTRRLYHRILALNSQS
jgi:glycosyltransferase involved in cell wall biosynthesis